MSIENRGRIRLGKGASQYEAVLDGEVVETFNQQPTLDTIRECSRKHGSPLSRLDVLDSDIVCTNCDESLGDRFSSDMQGNILCWNCANQLQESEDVSQRPSVDPAKVVLSQSGLYHKSLCDYVINVATGCTHGCKFCYVPSTPNISARQDMLKDRSNVEDAQEEWGSYLLYRDDLPERLSRKLERKQKWKSSPRGRGVVMFSSGTDCYQDRRTAQITRGCIVELANHGLPVRILTRSPAVVRDLDLFKSASKLTEDGMLIRVGSSIPNLDDNEVRAIEPGAPVPSARLDSLQRISDAGVPVYISMSPTYPTQGRQRLSDLMERFADLDPEVVFHEPINPRGGNFRMTINAAKEAGEKELADELEKLLDRDYWVQYSLNHMEWVEEFGDEFGVDVHIWPDKQVIKSVDKEVGQTLQRQRENPSPEEFPDVPLPN